MPYRSDPKRKAVRQKAAQVEATLKEISSYPTVALLELTHLPDALFQLLRKKIREERGTVKVLKKPVLERVLAKVPSLSAYAEKADRPFALLLTPLSPLALNKFFTQNRKKRAAKTGEKAPFEIVVPAGDTDLPPGPALSELKSAGLNVQIKAGKIAISKDSVVAKPGETITDAKAKALQKLGVLPFEVMARMYVASDGKYAYTVDILNIGETLPVDLGASLAQGTNFSLNANYPTPQTAPLLLQQALHQAIDLSLNASVYNNTTIEAFLSSAVLQGRTLDAVQPSSGKPSEEKKENQGDEK